jgi:hypothetical protein
MAVLVTVPGKLEIVILAVIYTNSLIGLFQWNILTFHWFNNGMLLETKSQSKFFLQSIIVAKKKKKKKKKLNDYLAIRFLMLVRLQHRKSVPVNPC